ncbi:Myb-like DNA-binding domain containing protein [Tritrichomonas foetus]|uniref:Myb-like DNA-binding domain containing protein n=1 Tax=Tritrichomonas foetus TaxID=1144522 RepID=A0A1J4JLD9_9EUKA|nr:Myb-like DNA-binding domain containing protein [Tritrichomonas foetus]|eukprot:OHS99489.1 Myb-like DNA-binding domain containing protein [Tritrichomonas foetus]
MDVSISPKMKVTKKYEVKPHSKFSLSEDQQLFALVQVFGEQKWRIIAKMMKNRNSRQCRERWNYYLNPKLNRNEWTQEEDDLIQKLYEDHGSRWVLFTKFFKRRTDAMIKNRFNQLKRHQEKNTFEFNKISNVQNDHDVNDIDLNLDIEYTEMNEQFDTDIFDRDEIFDEFIFY